MLSGWITELQRLMKSVQHQFKTHGGRAKNNRVFLNSWYFGDTRFSPDSSVTLYDVNFCGGVMKCYSDKTLLQIQAFSMRLHVTAAPHFNEDYWDSRGFQNINCRWGLWPRPRHYLLNPNNVIQYFTCRLQGHEAHQNHWVEFIHQQRSQAAATGPPWHKSHSHLTHVVNLLGGSIACPAFLFGFGWWKQMKLWGFSTVRGVWETYGCFPWPQPFSSCCPNSSRAAEGRAPTHTPALE